jgi:molybdate transport system permease protein
VRARVFEAGLWVAATSVVAFLLLPVVAIFARVPLGDLVSQLSNEVVRDALRVTVKTNLVALTFVLVLGTPTAYLIATRSFRGRALVLTLIELPLVLPPAVAGIGLLAAFGRLGLLGGTLDFFGVRVGLGTQAAVVLAVMFVAGPFYVRPAIAAFEAVDPTLLGAARTLGAGPGRTFFRVALPLAAGGLGAGAALAFARGLGEFGATIMFAGSLQGVTQTLSLAIYQEFDLDFDSALAISAFLVLVSGILLLSVKLIVGWRSTYTSLIPFARSPSTSS